MWEEGRGKKEWKEEERVKRSSGEKEWKRRGKEREENEYREAWVRERAKV